MVQNVGIFVISVGFMLRWLAVVVILNAVQLGLNDSLLSYHPNYSELSFQNVVRVIISCYNQRYRQAFWILLKNINRTSQNFEGRTFQMKIVTILNIYFLGTLF